MNKNELVGAIAEKAGLSKVDSKKALDAFEEAVVAALANGENVALIGFGTFSVSERAARTGVNPATGAKIQIDAKKVAKFKAGAKLAAAV
ncbi:MAG: HU family DNA-binding protein [Prevotellaceae bacterium]|jgi:DNA-binding protein HU-beta|nr:HU family DNA-binding protein [Prevotellaceae bacterium]